MTSILLSLGTPAPVAQGGRARRLLSRMVDPLCLPHTLDRLAREDSAKTRALFLENIADRQVDPPTAPTLHIGELVRDPKSKLGPKRKIRKAKGDPWRSDYEPEPKGYVGDIRKFPLSAGSSQVGELYGWSILSDTEATVGTPERFNNVSDAINKTAGKEIIRVRVRGVKGRIPNPEFLDDFGRRWTIPISETDLLMLHDLNFHSATILLPLEEMDLVRRQVVEVLDFYEFVKKKNVDPKVFTENYEKPFEQIFDYLANHLDVGTGNAMGYLHLGLLKDVPQWGQTYLTSGGMSPAELLAARVEAEWPVPEDAPDPIGDLLESYALSKRHDSSRFEGLELDPDSYVTRLNQRRAQVQDAALRMKAKGIQ